MFKTFKQLADFEKRPEYFGGFIEFCFGMIILDPYSKQFEKFPKIYIPMRALVDSEWFWGGFYTLIGLFVILAIRFDILSLKKYASLLLAFSFISKASLLLMGDGINPGVSTYGICGIFFLWQFFDYKKIKG